MGGASLCVLCRARPLEERWRPFCSARCKSEDLVRWATGRYRAPGEPMPTVGDTLDDAQ